MSKNSQKRIYLPGHVYFTTTNTSNRYPYFAKILSPESELRKVRLREGCEDCHPRLLEPIFCQIFMHTLILARQMLNFKLIGTTINTDHVHLMTLPQEPNNISKIMHFIKRHYSRSYNYIIGKKQDHISPPESELCKVRLRGNINEHFISRYYELLKSYRDKFQETYGRSIIFKPFDWQKSYHDHIIRGEKDFDFHVDYIQFNYHKHKLQKHPFTKIYPNGL